MNHSLSGTPQTRREARFVVVLWLTACLYTVGYAAAFAYRKEPNPALVFGMPSWVVWGVLAPWTVCTLLTLWFAFWGMKDEDLGEEHTLEADRDA